MIKLKRAYADAEDDDGLRILVDRLWPRGVAKRHARIDEWPKEIAPSPALRTWFGHDPARWAEFGRRYFAELEQNPDAVAALRALIARRNVTFVYAAKDQEHTHAIVLRDFIERKSGKRRAKSASKPREKPAATRAKTPRVTKTPRSTRPPAAPRRRS